MSAWTSIAVFLAEDGEGVGQVLVLVIMAAIWILGAVGKKIGQKKVEEKAQAESAHHRERMRQLEDRRQKQAVRSGEPRPAQPPQPPLSESTPSAAKTKLKELFQTVAESSRSIADAVQKETASARPIEQPPEIPEAVQREVASAQQDVQSPWDQPQPKPVPPPARRASHTPRPAVRQARQRQQDALARAQRQSVAPVRRRSSAPIAGGSSDRSSSRSKFLLGLIDQDDARRAIVFHEIFSKPKALRSNDELWD
jgi:hypothetical protein